MCKQDGNNVSVVCAILQLCLVRQHVRKYVCVRVLRASARGFERHIKTPPAFWLKEPACCEVKVHTTVVTDGCGSVQV